MSIELTCLLWSALVGIVYLNVQAFLHNKDNTGGVDPRRDRETVVGIHAARAGRALRNFLETYPIFIAMVVVAELANRHGVLTHWGAVLYLAARIVYLPLYLFGFGLPRSAVWVLSLIGLVLMFLGLVF